MNAVHTHPVDRFRHEALLYSGWPEFLEGTIPFIRGGVRAGEPVLVVESRDKIAQLKSALGDEASAVMFSDMADVGANPARIIPAWQDFVARHGVSGKRLRGIGEPIWKERSADELIECQRHESLLNVAFGHGQAWWLLCPYDIEKLDANVVDEARRSHEFVSERSHAWRSELFRGIEASGTPFDAPLPDRGTAVAQITFGLTDLASVRRLVSNQAEAAGLGAGRSAELVVAVNEVATNSVTHGGGGGEFTLWLEQDGLICEIRDRGRFNKALGDRERPAQRASAPRGLWLANQLCDLVQIRTLPDGTVVQLHMRRPASQNPGSGTTN